jgi:hypothetical protein
MIERNKEEKGERKRRNLKKFDFFPLILYKKPR